MHKKTIEISEMRTVDEPEEDESSSPLYPFLFSVPEHTQPKIVNFIQVKYRDTPRNLNINFVKIIQESKIRNQK